MKIFTTILLVILLTGNAFSQNWLQQRIVSEQFEKALKHYDEGRFATAENMLQKLLKKPAGDHTFPILLLAMKTNFALGRLDKAKELGKQLIKNKAFLSESFLIMGDIFIEEGDIDVAFRMYLRSRQLDKQDFIKIDQRLHQTILLNISPRAVEEQHLLVSGENELILLLAQAYNFLHDGNPDECAFVLSKINPSEVPESFYKLYEELQLASYQLGVETVTFGVVLPLSGKNASSGTTFLRGLYQYADRPDQTIKIAFQIEDNRSDPLETIKAVKRLGKNRQIYGIITSLDKTKSLAAVNAISDLSIPIFVTGGNEIAYSEISENVYQIQADWMRQGRYAARWIAENLGKDSVAVMTPNDTFGEVITDAFLKEMDVLDRKVVAVERYTGKPENLKKQFQALRQIAFNLIPPENPYDEYLGMSFDSADALFDISAADYFELNDDDENEEIKDSSKVILNTIQALYLPIHLSHLNYIGTQLPMYNLNTSLVGNYAWNQPRILAQDNVGPHLKNMTILSHKKIPEQDQSEEESLADENEDYLLGFDISGMLISILNSGILDKTEFVEKLEQEYYEGIAYTISFTPDDHSNQSVHILEIEDNKFLPIGIFVGDSVQLYIQQRP
jgi:ABC-type branched-subunit amino acid transport system substrate-binding protein